MADDVLPDILANVKKEFEKRYKSSDVIKQLLDDKTSFSNANKFSKAVGEILADVLGQEVTIELLPDGHMYFNIADRLLRDVLGTNHRIITKYAEDVQAYLNKQAKIGLKIQSPKINNDRIVGLVNRLDETDIYDDIAWIMNAPIVNFSQAVVDDFIKSNVSFHAKTGLKPKITRIVVGKCCEWCEQKAGTYDYPVPDDFYMRHQRCDCIVEYHPRDGRGIQNSHTKKWR